MHRTARLLSAFALTCVIGGAGAPDVHAQAGTHELTQNYESSTHAFTIDYPEGWERGTNAVSPAIVAYFTSPADDGTPGVTENVTVTVVPRTPDWDDLERLEAQFRASKDFNVVESGMIQPEGADGNVLRLIRIAEGDERDMAAAMYIFTYDDIAVLITGTVSAPHLDDFIDEFDAMAESFRRTDG